MIRKSWFLSRRGRRRGWRLRATDNSGGLVGVAVAAVDVVALVDGRLVALALDVVVREVGQGVAELAVGGELLCSVEAKLLASDISLKMISFVVLLDPVVSML